MIVYGLIAVGMALMLLGIWTLWQWNSGTGWIARSVRDGGWSTKNDRQFQWLYFISLVIAPLLGGAILILFGLREVLR